MATTVVLGSAILNAVAIKYLLRFDFDWEESFILGVLLSATDHVAVAAYLKDIFASKRLETLIAGETSANEVAVIVLVTVML